MIVYIAGKVTDTPLVARLHKFWLAQTMLKAEGHTPINPLLIVKDPKTPWQAAMRLCITALMTADAVYALPCCKDSKGAKLELQLAKQLGIPVYDHFTKIPKDKTK